MARTAPGEVRAELPPKPPENPERFDAIFSDLDRIVLPGLSHWQHPRFFGYFPCNGSLSSVLGDYLSTGLGVLGLSWQSSPALTEVEEVMTDWLRQMVGLSDKWSGVIQDTASTSTLLALICGANGPRITPLPAAECRANPSPSASMFPRTATAVWKKPTARIGRKNVRVVPHDSDYGMRADALAEMVRADAAAGTKPCAVVATTGTTTTTAFDPVAAIGDVAREHNLWLHVDAAMAGSAMILPEYRALWEGIESADSMVLNPHKWLGAAMDCSVYYVRDPQHLVRVMSTNPSYLRSAVDEQVKNLRDWGIPLGRRFRAPQVVVLDPPNKA